MPQTVLVVDDNEKIVHTLSEYLIRDGFNTLKAFDGATAQRLFESHDVDLALLDIMLPEISGLDLAKMLLNRDVPVILVTAKSEEIDKLIGLGIGADDYVTKPFSPREVVARVQAVLRRSTSKRSSRTSKAGVAEKLTFGDLVIDPEKRAISIQNRTIDLTKTEFEILLKMASNPGRVYSRLQLMDALGIQHFEGYERNIDAHIKNLRRKLALPKEDRGKYIKTVIGVGYRMGGS